MCVSPGVAGNGSIAASQAAFFTAPSASIALSSAGSPGGGVDAEVDGRHVDGHVGCDAAFLHGGAARAEVEQVREQQPGAVGQRHDLLAAGPALAAFADDRGALVPGSAAANTSAAPDVPLSARIATGTVSAPSPAAAFTACFSWPRLWRKPSTPEGTNRRATSNPASRSPVAVPRTSITTLVAPPRVSDATSLRTSAAVPRENSAIRTIPVPGAATRPRDRRRRARVR